MPHRAPVIRRAVFALAVAPAVSLVGCGGRLDDSRATTRTIGVEAFAGPLAERTQPRINVEAIDRREDTGQGAIEPALASDFEAVAGAPVAAGPAAPVEAPALVEAKVGDINGRPIFASEFLEPLSGRFEAEARRMRPRAWQAMANEDIVERLNDLVLDELLRAEALERLTPEQRVGFRGFLETLRRDLLSANYGSREVAERRLREQSGLTEEQWLARQREQSLIQVAIQDQIRSRVTVSFRDIRQRYDRDIDIYRPDPAARFRIVRARGEADAAEVSSRLAGGASLAEIAASDLNAFERETDGVRLIEFEPPREEAEFFGGVLNDAARDVREGEVRGPIDIGSSVYWITLERIEREERSLYDAQLEIEQRIRSERTQEELQRFLQTRVERANVTSLEDMRRRLLAIAAARYGPRAASG